MSTHRSRVFLHSCLKVPIDPCNNCPAPKYNRPKMCLEPIAKASNKAGKTCCKPKSKSKSKNKIAIEEPSLPSTSVRSLAKLYDSIPDYSEMHHLPQEEFYSKLNTLRSSCRALSRNSPPMDSTTNSTETSSTSSMAPHTLCGKGRKRAKCKKSSSRQDIKNKGKEEKTAIYGPAIFEDLGSPLETPTMVKDAKNNYENQLLESIKLRSTKEECAKEVAKFKQALKEYEKEFNSSLPSPSTSPQSKLNEKSIKEPKSNAKVLKTVEKLNRANDTPTKEAHAAQMRTCSRIEKLRKSYSASDIKNVFDELDAQLLKNEMRNNLLNQKQSKTEYPPAKDKHGMQAEKKSTPEAINFIQIKVESPSSELNSSKPSTSTARTRSRTKIKKCNPHKKLPFSCFNWPTKKSNSINTNVSPVHPVARPNLAATLRVEVSRQKIKELQNNCTFSDTTPQFDWEVRNTPAWKSLSLNESHQEILALRLAARKAEQALQQRRYEQSMAIMRQRVKSAPLLLEGPTHWGPNVGKLTHNCPIEGLEHDCEQNKQRKQRHKGGCKSRNGCNGCFTAFNKCEATELRTNSSVSCGKPSNLCTMKHNVFCRLYAGRRSKSNARSSPRKNCTSDIRQFDSGDDELSSVDRAFL